MTAIVAIRPPPGDAATLKRAGEAGIALLSMPMFRVEPVAWTMPDIASLDALLLGSANIMRHGGAKLSALTGIPAWCVGETTAEAARAAGFTLAHVGAGGLQPVAERAVAMGARNLLRLSGEAHVPLSLAEDARLDTRVVYRVAALPLPGALAALADEELVVLLHSAEAARHFSAEVERVGLPRGRIALACLAPRIASAAGAGWRAVEVAETVDDAALLALAAEMCKGGLERRQGPEGTPA
ncbi:uroporphyrinogen-III synthase [uncultured Croceicoccus sp.]|uniref:uroporphyrinogen-III synthase n=1 Tax=uncultured Croceicoccus sp. TaxID=1295329 RepID=UPI00262AC5BF|nr:uroporphyrinogen-III synthase [uncultured Croceicoccus sp.]